MLSHPHPVFTIGHSSRPLEEWLELLRESGIECIVDVRRLPGSRSYPQYNADALGTTLATHNIDYWYLPALCGRRTRRELNGAPSEDFWTNASFARYAAYARGQDFAIGLQELIDRSQIERCALLCSEAVWWRCHRRIIADHLLARGIPVLHIMGKGRITPAALTSGAIMHGAEVIYPPPASGNNA